MIISFRETSVDFVTEQVLFAHSRVLFRMLWRSSQILPHSRCHLEYHQISLCVDAECCSTPWIFAWLQAREASSNINKPLAHSSCWLLFIRRTEIISHNYKQNICAMFSCDSHQNSMEELCGLWGKTLAAQQRALSLYVETETQNTIQFSREVWDVKDTSYARDFPPLSPWNEFCWERPTWTAAWIPQKQNRPSCQMPNHQWWYSQNGHQLPLWHKSSIVWWHLP